MPVILIRNQVYLVGSAKCILSKKGDVLFCKNTGSGILTNGTLLVKFETFIQKHENEMKYHLC